MSTMPNEAPGDPLAGVMDDTGLELNDALSAQEAAAKLVPEDATEQADEEGAPDERTEDAAPDAEKPKKNKTPRDERIRELVGEKKDLLRQIEELKNGPLQSQIDEIKKLLTPPGNVSDTQVARDAAPDPTDLEKYHLGDLDPAYTRDLVRWEIRQEQAAEHQRQVQREAKAQQERHASEILGKVSELADKGAAVHADYVETVVQPFMQGLIPLEEHTFLAASEAEHGADVLRELALDRSEAARVAAMTPYQQTQYVAAKNNEIAARKKPRLPQAGAPPNSQARGTGGRFGVRGDEDDLDAIEKELYRRR